MNTWETLRGAEKTKKNHVEDMQGYIEWTWSEYELAVPDRGPRADADGIALHVKTQYI